MRCDNQIVEKQKQLKVKSILEKKKINCKIIEIEAEIVSESKANLVSFLLKTYNLHYDKAEKAYG